jgi:hypothetical protein
MMIRRLLASVAAVQVAHQRRRVRPVASLLANLNLEPKHRRAL